MFRHVNRSPPVTKRGRDMSMCKLLNDHVVCSEWIPFMQIMILNTKNSASARVMI